MRNPLSERALSLRMKMRAEVEEARMSIFYDGYIRRGKPAPTDDRVRRVVRAVPATVNRLLDVGCGTGRNLQAIQAKCPQAELYGIDIGSGVEELLKPLGFQGKQCDASERIPYDDNFFDVVVCGEVIEHVVATDSLLAEIRRVLKPGALMILTTPNLAYLVNRVMLFAGLQPFFTETSMRSVMGRRLKLLGQGNPVQGHLRLFTLPALLDIARSEGFTIERIEGYRWLNSGISGAIDAVLSRRPALAAGFVLTARAPQSDIFTS